MNIKQCLEDVFTQCCSGSFLDRQTILRLLAIAPLSEDALHLRRLAHQAALLLADGQAYLWSALGVDHSPCTMNCRFCSFGAAWRLISAEKIYSDAEILEELQKMSADGAHYLIMRTTEFFNLDHLCSLLEQAKKIVPPSCELILNTGEFNAATAKKISHAGAAGIYHALRLREGKDTPFQPEERLATMRAVKSSPLKLISLVEPIGPEHSNEELADNFLQLMDIGVDICGVMARVPVPGTPLGSTAMISS